MPPALPLHPGSTLALSAAAAAAGDLSEHAMAIVAAVVAVLCMMVVAVYLHQLNNRHARLLDHLESELSERKKAEERLRASEGFYHSLVESLPAAIFRKDREGRFTFGNQKFYAALGVHDPGQFEGKTDLDFFPAAMARKFQADDQRVMEAGRVFEAVEEFFTPLGETIHVQVIKTPLTDNRGHVVGVQGIFWDVTERKKAEETLVLQNVRLQEMAVSEREAHAAVMQAQSQLVQAEKLASLGLIVAGVAHEINNPVSFVTNNVAVLGRDVGELRDLINLYKEADDLIARDRPDLADRVHEFCDRVDMPYTLSNIEKLIRSSRDGLKRIQQIVGHLRLFAHLDEGDVNEADLIDGIESTAAILVGYARKKSIALKMDLTPIPTVSCNVAKVNQVVMNLLTNAIDASPEGGTVHVRTRPEPGGVRIEVADEGCGIEPAVRDRIFDPFFTTKPVGQGTGLGLSISYGIVKDHGGSIEVDSSPGRGACFVVHLPLRPPPKEQRRATDGESHKADTARAEGPWPPPRADRRASYTHPGNEMADG